MATITWGLEYALLFGIPSNKIEYWDGCSRWAFPFVSRDEAEAHFQHWIQDLERWKGNQASPVRKGKKRWKTEIAGIAITLFPRPIEFRIPLKWNAFERLLNTFGWPEMWPGEWPAWHCGWLTFLDHQDVQMNLWSLFSQLSKRHGGQRSGRVDIAMTDTAVVAPDQFYFRKTRDECMIDGNYFRGVPDLIAEVDAPASVAIDRGPRREVYRRAGVPQLWLLNPVSETVEILELQNRKYCQRAIYGLGDTFENPLFPAEKIEVDQLFQTQSKKHESWRSKERQDLLHPVHAWILPAEMRLGLEYFFLLGHPEHRWEIWGNRVPAVLAFGSVEEAKVRLEHFIEDACRWEGSASMRPAPMAPDIEQAEVGRFKLTRSGRYVHLDTAVDTRKYVELMHLWEQSAAWDWGDRKKIKK